MSIQLAAAAPPSPPPHRRRRPARSTRPGHPGSGVRSGLAVRPGVRAPGEQLAAEIRHRILLGRLRPGDRLPPVRQLAAFLRVNRNTVAQVYRRLAAQGYLRTDGRRGTFVRRGSLLTPEVVALLDRLARAAARAGLTPAELQSLVTVRGSATPGRARALPPAPRLAARVGFVECNPVDLAYFRRLLEAQVGGRIRPVPLGELPRAAGGCAVLVTTFFHLEEVQRRVPDRPVLGLAALPDFATLAEVARLPRGTRVALVCATREGAEGKARSLRAVGLRHPRLRTATLADPPDCLAACLREADVLLAAPRVLERLRAAIPLPRRLRVIPFASVLSEGSLAALRAQLAALGAAL